ncbi:hypothetical protein DNG45_00900 [Salmonella enterica]|nr:hypothetical protein [Salmonella enterica]EBL9173652.1 hypothetical protein [Salmonella enterica]
MKRSTGMSAKFSMIMVLVAPLYLSGCTTVTDLSASGGSRADGTVTMSAEYGEFDIVKLNKTNALDAATKRCQSWGYKSAEPFDTGFRRCTVSSGLGGCSRYIYSIQYQCLK